MAAMAKTFGNITLSAKNAGIERQTVYLWEKTDPIFAEKFRSDEWANIYMDTIEYKLAKLGIQDENPTVLIFLAKTKCQSRGYIEKQDFGISVSERKKEIAALFPTIEEIRELENKQADQSKL